MSEWEALGDLIGTNVVDSWQFFTGLAVGAVLLLVLSLVLSHHRQWVISLLVGLLSVAGFTILVGFAMLDSYNKMDSVNSAMAALMGILPWVALFILLFAVGLPILGARSASKVGRKEKGSGPDAGNK